MGLGSFPEEDELSLQMLGMHGTVSANYAIDQADLLLVSIYGTRITSSFQSVWYSLLANLNLSSSNFMDLNVI